MAADFIPIRTTEKKLSEIEIIDRQLIFCTDSGFIYRDTESGRVKLGNELEVVDELPAAPVHNHFYYSKADRDLFFYDGEWNNVSENELDVTQEENEDGVVLVISENKNPKSSIPIKGKGATVVFMGNDGSISIKTKEPDVISNLEIDKLLSI